MKLDDFLKFKKVRYIKLDGKGLTNKEYELLGVTDRSCIISDNGCEIWASMDNFEPVLDSAENPLQNIELTPEFEAVEPKFKVGDRVYTGIDEDIKVIKQVKEKFVVAPSIPFLDTHYPISEVCHATSENHEMLCKLYPHIKFEAPPKELTGSDLARAMFDKGHEYVVGRVGNHVGVYYTWSEGAAHFFEVGGTGTFYIEPIDPKTGEPLTESILND